ncbi:MAG: ARPP-1 family domain-containing protein, partial [Gemmataceae bacterium]
MFELPEIHIGEPIGYGEVTVFPLFGPIHGMAEYILADEGIESGLVTVLEKGESGSVPELVVDNQAEIPVLFLEGEELRGAKQNRVLNLSVLIAAKTQALLPVSCVEQGRWQYTTRKFGSTREYSSPKLRHILKRTVYNSAIKEGSLRSDQG